MSHRAKHTAVTFSYFVLVGAVCFSILTFLGGDLFSSPITGAAVYGECVTGIVPSSLPAGFHTLSGNVNHALSGSSSSNLRACFYLQSDTVFDCQGNSITGTGVGNNQSAFLLNSASVTNVTIINCGITAVDVGVIGLGAGSAQIDINISNNNFTNLVDGGSGARGIDLEGGTTDGSNTIYIDDNRFVFTSADSSWNLYGITADDAIQEDFFVRNNVYNVSALSSINSSVFLDMPDAHIHNSEIIGNTVVSSSSRAADDDDHTGIRVRYTGLGTRNVDFSSNTLTAQDVAINISRAASSGAIGFTIEGNTISDARSRGIIVTDHEDGTISSNTVDGTSSLYALYVRNFEDSNITDNNVTGGLYGLYAFNATIVNVFRNNFTASKTGSYLTNESTQVVFTNNTYLDNVDGFVAGHELYNYSSQINYPNTISLFGNTFTASSIADNLVFGPRYAIWFYGVNDSSGSTLDDSIISGPWYDGIRLQETTGLSFAQSSISGVRNNGVTFVDTTTVSLGAVNISDAYRGIELIRSDLITVTVGRYENLTYGVDIQDNSSNNDFVDSSVFVSPVTTAYLVDTYSYDNTIGGVFAAGANTIRYDHYATNTSCSSSGAAPSITQEDGAYNNNNLTCT